MCKKVEALRTAGLKPSKNLVDDEPSSTESDDDDEREGPYLSVTSGDGYQGPFDKDTSSLVFWRGDTRPPSEVFATGFSSRFVRDSKEKEIVWRAGVDDIVQDSAVCLALDVRGAAFFPYPPRNSEAVEDVNYMYAMAVPRAACTYDIQRMVEFVETKAKDWRNPERFSYNPTWSDYDRASCVWQFAEYEVPKQAVLAGWKCTRQILIKEKNDERVQGGIRFRLHSYQRNAAATNDGARVRAEVIANEYATEYPRRYPQFLSYWGIVKAMMVPAPSAAVARRTVEQLQAIIVQDDTSWNCRDDGGGATSGTVSLTAAPLVKGRFAAIWGEE
ncbi:MAG: hypothetical protein QM784_09120 [Polyangiaceae bacterium]